MEVKNVSRAHPHHCIDSITTFSEKSNRGVQNFGKLYFQIIHSFIADPLWVFCYDVMALTFDEIRKNKSNTCNSNFCIHKYKVGNQISGFVKMYPEKKKRCVFEVLKNVWRRCFAIFEKCRRLLFFKWQKETVGKNNSAEERQKG